MPTANSGALEANDDELAIEVTFEADDEQSGVKAIPSPPPEPEGHPAASSAGAAVPTSYVPHAPVVLLVDDEPLIRHHVAAALAPKYTVYEASDGAEGLATLARMPRPDCIVCDVNMPRLGGIQFARALKMLTPMRRVPVAFLSSSRDPRAVCDAINAGAKHFLSKKDTPDHILAKLERILSAVPSPR